MSTLKNADSMMLLLSVRYALGRCTYIVSEVCGWVRLHWPELDVNIRALIMREVSQRLEMADRTGDLVGMQMDHNQWADLHDWMKEKGTQ